MWRFTSSDTLVETVVLWVHVLDADSGLVELGSTPLVVPQFYGLSNAIDSQVLKIQSSGKPGCTVRLMNTNTGVPSLGRLVTEDDSAPRKGKNPEHD